MAIYNYRGTGHWQSIIPPGRHWCPCGCGRYWDSNNITHTYGTATVYPYVAPKQEDVVNYEETLKRMGILE